MFTLPDHFRYLLNALEPESDRAKKASDIPAQVRAYLESYPEIKTMSPYTRLAGSYARHTAIKRIKDVDILLFVDSSYKNLIPAHILESLFQSLRHLPDELDDTGEVIKRRHQRRSVNIHLENADFDLDIVPVVITSDLEHSLFIPDKDWCLWVETHPLGYGQMLSNLNAEHQEQVVPLIKLFKHWRDEHMTYRRPKSYWLECLVYKSFAESLISTESYSYAALFYQLLSAVQKMFADDLQITGKVPEIHDPALGHNVAHNWERDDFEAFMDRIKESQRWAERALAQEDSVQAVQLWQKIFGEKWFLQETEEQAKGWQLAAALKEKNVSINRDGRIFVGKPVNSAVQPLSQRFYGEN